MLRTTKALMLATDVGFVAYFTVTGLGLIPPEWAFAGYTDPVMVAWNWSFLWIDLAASATGLTSLWLLRRASGPAGTPLMLVSLVLTMASGLMAVAFWTLRGDFSLMWWIPNLYLLLFPLPAVVALVTGPRRSPATGEAAVDDVGVTDGLDVADDEPVAPQGP
ncbi:YvaD family protein [Nonomuraea roseoviolacea subsp. roseoviolacea]|uniref:Succinate dehydrogenase hydrophobic anchor subunit n=1 Tax=Nonomuraea roseoviolacea subsp. carminata TaxID=160689 RepID=A0ABT1KE33_9ACTN|nr:DUF5360 family protein [Nonomuraea roseoviolacea]MCP2352273.1 succinate dehydrogenase hydrophobic anchor subunit [Nonomuraea roseoviolacea subsp. carminata]